MELQRPWMDSSQGGASRTLAVPAKPLQSLIEDVASRSPGNICLSYQGASFTYSEVEQLSSRFATGLASLGLKRGDRVAIFMPNMPQFVLSYFGTLKAGGIAVPCSPLYKEKELEYQIKDSGASFIVAANDVVGPNDLFAPLEACRGRLDVKATIAASVTDYLPGIKRTFAGLAGVKNVGRANTVRFRQLCDANEPMTDHAPIDPVKDVAVLQYTGGTTGVSKGAMLSHANLYLNAVAAAMSLPLGHDDVALAALPLFHIYGMTTAMNAPFYAGARVVLLPRFNVEEVMKTIEKEKATSFCGVPTMYIAVINHPNVSKFNLHSIRSCISGGAPLPVAVRKRFIEITGSHLVEGYGLTEASPVTHCNPIGEGAVVKDGSIGVPVPGTDAAIVDMEDPSRFLPVGEEGELAVMGPQVMLGYWNRKDETDMVLRNGWLLTGDIAKMDEQGYFFIVDRKKDLIDVGGFKVWPREVEEVLFTHPGVREAAVVGVQDDYRGESVKAFVILKPEARGRVTEQELVDFCRAHIAKYKAPRSVVFVDELPKTLVGKVLRRKLRDRSDWEKDTANMPQRS
ncbi:MAG: long-chain fatty acid--CoA ligase [Nitrososphaerota archaeon]|nr:long-chain fatty acid--CoA ligase [Nitrososphaerota archaeon]